MFKNCDQVSPEKQKELMHLLLEGIYTGEIKMISANLGNQVTVTFQKAIPNDSNQSNTD